MSESLSSIKLVLLGDSGVGKTSIVTHYVSGSAANNVKPTIGAAFVTKEINVDGKSLELLIWDTAGQEVYRGLAPMYYRSALIAIIVFDVTRIQSYEAVSYWIKELKTNVDGNIIILVCGNKTDLDDQRVIESNTAQTMADGEGALYAETSATTGAGIERMFQLAVSKLLSTRKTDTDQNQQKGVNLKDNQNQKQSGGCC